MYLERLSFHEAMRQAETNIEKTQSPEAPIVVNRRNRESTGDSLIATERPPLRSAIPKNCLPDPAAPSQAFARRDT